MKLYQHAAELEAIFAELSANDGELTEELEIRLAEADIGFEEKVEQVALKIRELQVEAAAAKGESTRLAKKSASRLKQAENLAGYMMRDMRRVGKTEVDRPLAGARIQDSPPAASYDGDLDDLPSDLVRVKPEEREFNRAEALKWHRAHRDLPDGVSITTDVHLRIL